MSVSLYELNGSFNVSSQEEFAKKKMDRVKVEKADTCTFKCAKKRLPSLFLFSVFAFDAALLNRQRTRNIRVAPETVPSSLSAEIRG